MSVAHTVESRWSISALPLESATEASSARAPGFGGPLVKLLPELQRRARYLAGRSVETHDLVQETCRRALDAQRRFLPGSDLRAWMFCIMRNIHRDRLRTAGREILIGGGWENVSQPPGESRPLWLDTSDEDLGAALITLTVIHREVFQLHAVEGLRYSEIAQRLGIPVNTVATRLRRARIQIRRALEAARPIPDSCPARVALTK
jgi:RNA polymerase sigma-70 factor (ECF subfamily)